MKRLLALLVVIVLASAGFAAWYFPKKRQTPPPADLTIAFTGDVHGRLVPCGCFSGQMGGLTRIATLLDGIVPASSLRLDVGNTIEGPADYQRIQYRYLLQAFHDMGYEAANLGHAEARLSAAQIRELKAQSPVRLLSANLLDRTSGTRILDAYRIVERCGWRVAIVGVMDEHAAADTLGEGLAIEPMEAALGRLLPEVRKQSDFMILLAFTDEAGLHRLARDFYEFQVILGGKVSQPAQKLEHENRSAILYTTNQSRALGTLEVTLTAPGKLTTKSGDVMLVNDHIPEADEIRKLARKYRDEVRTTKLDIDDPAKLQDDLVPGVKSAARYVGSESCIVCHRAATDIWQKTGHAHAFNTLVRAGADADPNCIGCHTVGFGTPTGYRREYGPKTLTDVGCENCHGPGSLHVEQHRLGKEITAHFRKIGAGDCQKCHHGEFSRPFDWNSFWPVIAHGLDAPKMQ